MSISNSRIWFRGLILGLPGSGKTSLVRSLPRDCTLLASAEDGTMSIEDILETDVRSGVRPLRITNWQALKDMAVILAGPNLALPLSADYSKKHWEEAVKRMGADWKDGRDTLVVDSITRASTFCMMDLEPRFPDRKDTRPLYMAVASEMKGWMTVLHTAPMHIIHLGQLDSHKMETDGEDEGKLAQTAAQALIKSQAVTWTIQMEGQAARKHIMQEVDFVFTLAQLERRSEGQVVKVDGVPVVDRRLVTGNPNPWGFPIKCRRSDRFGLTEEPDLGRIIVRMFEASKPAWVTQERRGWGDVEREVEG